MPSPRRRTRGIVIPLIVASILSVLGAICSIHVQTHVVVDTNDNLDHIRTGGTQLTLSNDCVLESSNNNNSNDVATSSTPLLFANRTVSPKLFHCGGYALNRNFQPTLQTILPEYEWTDLRQVSDWKSSHHLIYETNPFDIFVSDYQLLNDKKCSQNPSFYQWLHLHFAGNIVFWTPEDATNYLPVTQYQRPNYKFLGPGAPFITLTFLQTAFWAQVPWKDKVDYFFGDMLPHADNAMSHHLPPPRRPKSTTAIGKHFLIYAHSNCVGERQTAFRKIANANGLPTVHYGGKCNGNLNKNNIIKAQPYPNKVRLSNWEQNLYLFQDFRFCLTMEHVQTPGYITEKILVAMWAGCIPIYWGPREEISKIFHPDSFLYWDPNNPEPTLDRIRYLEHNRSAMEEMLQNPILAPGAMEAYFSFNVSVGGGVLQRRIRQYLEIAM